MLGSSKVNKGPYRVVSTNLNNRPPTFEILEACSIHPDIEDPVERALYERRKPEVPVSRQRQGSEAGGGGGGGPIVLDGVDEEIKAVIVAFHASLVERMPDVPRTIHRLDVLGDGILVKFRDLSVCPFVNRVHARNKPTVYMFINKTRCSLRCFDENCRNSFKPVLMDAALAEAMERRHAPAGAQPLQRRDPVALHRYIQSLPAIKIQIPAAILPKRVVFGSSWEGDLFLATELFDGGRAFNLHTCQGPERPHASALVTFKKDRASGCVCFRTDSTGHRILMPQCAIYPSRSLWPVVGIDLHFQADQEEGEIRLPRLPQQRLIPLHDSQEINLILNELQNTHLDTGLAELFVQIQGNRFIRYLTKDDAWATFEKHVWEIGPRLSGAVGAIVKGACVPVLKHAISTFVAHARGGGDNNEQEGNVALSKEDAKFLAKLLEAKKHIEGTHGQNCVAQQLQTIECMVAKTESDFRGRLNKESHLFAFSNGVFDMRQGRFRPVEPEDMISINCGRAYDHEKINDVAARERVTDIVMGIFANVTEVGDFFMLELAGALGGHNLSQTMSCLLGGGANGKSTLLSLIMASFGNYVKTMYSSWITGLDKDSDSCTNQLIFVENARLIVISEMNEKEKVNKRRLKMLTGGDTIPIRGIREAFRDFRARAKLMCFTNYMPSFFGSVLHADMRRIRVYPMKMKYVADPDANNPFEAKIDRWLEASIAQLGDAFLGVLFDLYPRYISEEGSPDSSRPMPLTMVDAATDAFNSMDPLRSLITATYEKTADVNQYITTEEVISLAREHEKSLGELVFPVGRTKLLHGLDMILVGRILLGDERKILVGRSYVRGWRGWKRMDDEEEEE